MNLQLLAIDPGLRTGLADLVGGEFSSWEDPNPLAVCSYVETRLAAEMYDHVICEDFLITSKTGEKTQQHYSLEIIGAVKYLCYKYGVSLTMQTPSERKAMKPNLKKLGWYKGQKKDYEGHADDAAMHLGTYLMNQQDQEFLRRLYL